jgi:hypothetical protein
MAYNQAPLKNIGDIRDKITKRKLEKKFGGEVAAEKFKQIEDFRSRAAQINQPKFKTMETSFKSSIKPFEKETIKFDVPEKENTKTKPKSKLSKVAGKVGEGLKHGAVEVGHTVLDKLPLAGMTVGKRRVFAGDESGTQDYLFGKLTGLNEEKGHYKRYPASTIQGQGIKVKHFDRMTNREWRAEKKRRYTKKERLKNVAIKGSGKLAKGLFGVAAAIGYDNSGFGTEKGRTPGQGQKFIKEVVKKTAKKIKKFI